MVSFMWVLTVLFALKFDFDWTIREIGNCKTSKWINVKTKDQNLHLMTQLWFGEWSKRNP